MLKEIKEDDGLKTIPVVVLTVSKAEEDILKSYKLHANCYISKPVDQAVLLSKLREIARRIDRKGASPATGDPVARPADPVEASEESIDAGCLETLKSVMEPAEIGGFLEMYLVEAAARAASMSAMDDPGALAREAHALIGISGNVGAVRVTDLARTLELDCKSGDLAASRATLEALNTAIKETENALRAWLRRQ